MTHQPGVYVPLRALFLVFIYTNLKLIIEKSKWLTGIKLLMFHMITWISG